MSGEVGASVGPRREIGLEVAELRFAHARGLLLDGVSFRLRPGEMVALLGRNGVGKTTLLRCLTGFWTATGVVRWDGDPLSDLAPRRLFSRVALVDPGMSPPDEMTVRQVVALGRSPHQDWLGRSSAADRAAVDAALATVELTPLAECRFGELSQGEQQRVRLALALAVQPRYLLLDEPVTHLDPGYQRQVMGCLRGMARNEGVGILAVVHDLNLAAMFDRVLLLADGRVIADGPAERVLADHVLQQAYGDGVFRVARVGDQTVCVLNPIASSANPAATGVGSSVDR